MKKLVPFVLTLALFATGAWGGWTVASAKPLDYVPTIPPKPINPATNAVGWEHVFEGMYRFRVEGGWIYTLFAPAAPGWAVFVPDHDPNR